MEYVSFLSYKGAVRRRYSPFGRSRSQFRNYGSGGATRIRAPYTDSPRVLNVSSSRVPHLSRSLRKVGSLHGRYGAP